MTSIFDASCRACPRLSGFLDAHTFEQLDDTITELFDESLYKIIADLSGLEYLISRTGDPKLICSPYLCIEGLTGVRGVCDKPAAESVIENDIYLVRFRTPPFPPPKGSITSAESACLQFRVERKKRCNR